MARNVVILGAGASAQAGAPLMYDFLDISERILRQRNADSFENDFRLVFEGIYQLQDVLAKSYVDIENLEAVFGAFEMAKLCSRLGRMSIDEVSELGGALQRVILRTLELSMKHQGSPTEPLPPVGYNELGEFLTKVDPASITFITFNYDLGLDHAVYQATQRDPYYGFDSPKGRPITVLKLHGSMHWYKADQEHPYPIKSIPMGELRGSYLQRAATDQNKFNLLVSEKLRNLGNKSPFIVPPTWKKGDHYAEVAEVWKIAAAELATAKNIFVSGYSLPETDQYFRYLFALGSAGPARIERFEVFDPSQTTADRFQALLGAAARSRFRHTQGRFTNFVDWLRKENPLIRE